MKFDKLNRRMFLQGSGGIALACPLLPSMLSKELFAAESGGLDYIVMICHHYGSFDSQYFPNPGAVTPSFVDASQNIKMWNMANVIGTSPILSGTPFVDIVDKVSVYQGLDRFGWKNHSGEECLSGDRAGGFYGQTIDHFIANKIYSTSEPLVRTLALGPSGGRHDISFYYDAKANVLRRSVSHPFASSAIEYLFSNIGATPAQTEAIRSGNLSIVGSVVHDYKALINNPRLSKEDKLRLTRHLDLIRDLEKQVQNRVIPVCARPDPASLNGVGFGRVEHLHDLLEVAKTVISCGLSRVITITHHSNYLHAQSHSNQGPKTSDGSKTRHIGYVQPIMIEIANFCKSLDSMSAGGGDTKLDKGLVLVSSDMGSTTNHCPNSYPVLVVGGKGKVNTGKFIDYRNPVASRFNRGRPGQPYNRLLISLMQAMGLSYTDWEMPGGEPGFGSSAYSSYDGHHWDNFFKTYDRRSPLPKFFV